ncbi:hypothetical protein HYR99_35405 [Candidatus Poribacteria bacterium]|nr:hypothetical protein [Candidatus Poribacteria bacterium]
MLLSFLQNEISPLDFEQTYLDVYLNDSTEWSEAEFAILDELFGDVDAFCADATLRAPDDLDEAQLRQKCKKAIDKLRALETWWLKRET